VDGETGTRVRRTGDLRLPESGTGVPLVTDPASLRMATDAYSNGRLAIPPGSRAARTKPTRVATRGTAITIRNRLLQGT